jgi:hypothetical protein
MNKAVTELYFGNFKMKLLFLFFAFTYWDLRLGMVKHACNSSTGEAKALGFKFKTSLGYTVSPCDKQMPDILAETPGWASLSGPSTGQPQWFLGGFSISIYKWEAPTKPFSPSPKNPVLLQWLEKWGREAILFIFWDLVSLAYKWLQAIDFQTSVSSKWTLRSYTLGYVWVPSTVQVPSPYLTPKMYFHVYSHNTVLSGAEISRSNGDRIELGSNGNSQETERMGGWGATPVLTSQPF